MGSRKRKSKKQSNTKSGRKKQPELPVFFIDRCSGKAISVVFEDAGLPFELHDDHYNQTTLDVEWLADCGRRSLIVISSDKAIRKNQNEFEVFMTAKIGAFFFTSGDWSTKEKIESLSKALNKITNIATGTKRPFIARILKNGRVEMWYDHRGNNVLQRKQRR